MIIQGCVQKIAATDMLYQSILTKKLLGRLGNENENVTLLKKNTDYGDIDIAL